MKLTVIILGLFILVGGSLFFYQTAKTGSSYQGLPTVPCQDPTRPLAQQFRFSIRIMINGKNFPIDKNIGHDWGNCLHDIFVNDESGTVFVKANDNEKFNLGQFFDVWHKTFSQNRLFEVLINGKRVDTYRQTPLLPDSLVEVRYVF